MKKRKLFASGIISLAVLLLLPMYATDEVTHCAFAQETCLNEIFNDDDTVIVDTVDVDTMTIDIQQNDSTDEASDDGDDIDDDELERNGGLYTVRTTVKWGGDHFGGKKESLSVVKLWWKGTSGGGSGGKSSNAESATK